MIVMMIIIFSICLIKIRKNYKKQPKQEVYIPSMPRLSQFEFIPSNKQVDGEHNEELELEYARQGTQTFNTLK